MNSLAFDQRTGKNRAENFGPLARFEGQSDRDISMRMTKFLLAAAAACMLMAELAAQCRLNASRSMTRRANGGAGAARQASTICLIAS